MIGQFGGEIMHKLLSHHVLLKELENELYCIVNVKKYIFINLSTSEEKLLNLNLRIPKRLLFITFSRKPGNLNSANALNLRDAAIKCLETDLLRSAHLDAGGKPGDPEKTRRSKYKLETKLAFSKHCNKWYIQHQDYESNPGPFVHSAGEEPLCYP